MVDRKTKVSITRSAAKTSQATAGPVIRCTVCSTVIQSKHRHDFVWCKCNKNDDKGIFVDGGSVYFRFGGDISQAEIFENSNWVPLSAHFGKGVHLSTEKKSEKPASPKKIPSVMGRCLAIMILDEIPNADESSAPGDYLAGKIDEFLEDWKRKYPE